MATPTQATLEKITDIFRTIDTEVLPVVRNAHDTVTTVVNGHPQPLPGQGPSATEELVPKIGGLDPKFAAGGATWVFILGGLAVFMILMGGVRFRR